MTNKRIKRKRLSAKKYGSSSDHTQTDNDADKTGTDVNADNTVKKTGKQSFNKPRREVNPDTTGIDTKSDHTK
jgi:hypothetical protein